jgi:hypothetical protein
MKNQFKGFNGMVGESAAAQSSGNAGTRPETHTAGAAPRPDEFDALRSWASQGWEESKRLLGAPCGCEKCRIQPERK